MNKAILLALVLTFSISFVLAEERMTVEIDIQIPQDEVRIEVPDYVDLGEINWTYQSKSQRSDQIYVNNTGTVNVTVTPELDGNDEIFENLYFTKRLSGQYYNWTKIGDWSLDIERPSGSYRSDYFYMILDLTDFNGEINETIIGHTADVVFVAVRQ